MRDEPESAPDADRMEQQRPVGHPVAAEEPDTGIEVPEADAVEQAQPAPLDDEDGYPR